MKIKRTKTQNLISTFNGKNCCKGKLTIESQSCNTRICCNWGGVKITLHTHQTNSNKTKAYSSSVNSLDKVTYVKFTFTIPKNMEKIETHAAFCGNYKTCQDINTSNYEIVILRGLDENKFI